MMSSASAQSMKYNAERRGEVNIQEEKKTKIGVCVLIKKDSYCDHMA